MYVVVFIFFDLLGDLTTSCQTSLTSMCIVIVNQSFFRVCYMARAVTYMSPVEAFVTRLKILIGGNCAWLLDCFLPKLLVYSGSNLVAKHSFLYSIMTR